ncbi:MAG TPA: hybrid-cluster NAD(P)-dependent oxidoreductase [Paracoccaceae bacterium]|nr:hybrid-cluster NAD(P)-dependent oxidoreductase [Paracoccaceae bacterium]
MSPRQPTPRLRGATVWRDDEPLECVTVVPEAPNVATFSFRAPSGAWFDYQPGQFLTLELPVPGGAVHRTYTISSSPSRPLSVSVTVKAQEDSVGGRWMLDHLRPGDRIRAFGPAGIFSFLNHPAEKYLFISAGSGITPMMSMTAYQFDLGVAPDISFVNCARRPSEIIFRKRLEHMASRVPGIKLHFVVDEDDSFNVWTGYRGMFNQLMLGLMAPDYLEREIFCCGPEPFMQAVRDMLNAFGFDMSRYHQESFQAPVATEADAPVIEDVVPREDAMAEIHFAEAGVSARCAETDTILAVAKASGLSIPSGCTFGICGTCKVKRRAGQVHMVHNGGISEEDIEAGYILACCSRPIGRVEIAV